MLQYKRHQSLLGDSIQKVLINMVSLSGHELPGHEPGRRPDRRSPGPPQGGDGGRGDLQRGLFVPFDDPRPPEAGAGRARTVHGPAAAVGQVRSCQRGAAGPASQDGAVPPDGAAAAQGAPYRPSSKQRGPSPHRHPEVFSKQPVSQRRWGPAPTLAPTQGRGRPQPPSHSAQGHHTAPLLHE